MSCLALATRAVRVEGDGGVGFIFLGGGQVVHAETRSARGEDALMEILTWTHGRFSIEEGRTPPEETITRLWQSLLLEAAYRLDESRRPREGGREGKGANVDWTVKTMDGAEVTGWVRFTVQGERLGGRADDVEELQACWAYVLELSQAIGRTLGLEALASIEARGPEGRAACRIKGDRVMAVQARPGVDVAALADGGGEL